MHRTTIGQRWRVVGMRQAGMKGTAIACALDIPRSRVYDILKRHYQNPVNVKDQPRSGRHRVFTPRQDRRLGRLAIRNRLDTSRQLLRHWGVRASVVTVRRRLNQLLLRAQHPTKKPFLTERHRQVKDKNKRIYIYIYALSVYRALCIQIYFLYKSKRFDSTGLLGHGHQGNKDIAWPNGDVYIGGMSIDLSCFGEMVGCVWRHRGERYNRDCLVPSFALGRTSIMVWGCISYDCKLDLVEIRGNLNAQRYIDEVLSPMLKSIWTTTVPRIDPCSCRTEQAHTQSAFLRISCVKRLLMSCLGQAWAQTWTSSRAFGHISDTNSILLKLGL